MDGWNYYKGTSWEKNTGANPTDNINLYKRSIVVVDGKGVPLGITVDANDVI